MIKSSTLAIILAASFLAPQGANAGTAGGPKPVESTEAERVALEIDHAPLLKHQIAEAAEDSAFFVRDDVTKVLREVYGVDVVEDPAAPVVIVRLSWVNYEKSVYRVEIAIRRPGRDAETITRFERHFMNDTALSQGVADSLADAVAELRTPQDEPQRDQTAEPAPSDAPDEPGEIEQGSNASAADDSQRRVPLATLGKAGVGLLAGGVAVVGVGAGVLSQGKKFDEQDGQPLERPGRDYRPPGIAVLVSGGALLVAGAVMLGLDRRNAAKRKGSLVRVLPALNGMTIMGRF